jgi:manganese/zinc/iron transport system ATP- binding protein
MNGNKNIALEVQQLTVNYDKTAVLWDINFSLPAGKCVGVIGPNGAGKSTLLKSAMGFMSGIGGKVLFFDKPLAQVRQRVAYVPQRLSVDWDFPMTAFDLVLMGCYGKLGFFKWVSKKDKLAAKEALALVGMEGFADRQIGELSGGQQQRLFLARSFLQDADIYLMDEPFAGVDMATEKALITLFEELKKQGKTLMIVHHDLATVDSYFDWVVMLNTCLIAAGPTKDVYNEGTILRTYGRSSSLLHEAAKMAQEKVKGLK